jgi:transposase-like protein
MAESTMPLPEPIRKQLLSEPDLLRELVAGAVNALLSVEADALCGAEYGSRSSERTNRRNGYRERRWDTRAGSIELQIPKLREGSYFPDWLLDRRRRAEKALISVVADLYLAGVSTRRVEKAIQTLGVESISKSQVSRLCGELDELVEAFRTRPLDAGPYPFVMLDALVVKVREAGRIVNVCVVHATGVNAAGYRESLGLDLVTAEDGAAWLAFLRGLVARGLSGVQLVTSDAHLGLVDAIRSTLPGASWQRCRTHFMRNLLTRVPRSMHRGVATLVRTIFDQATPSSPAAIRPYPGPACGALPGRRRAAHRRSRRSSGSACWRLPSTRSSRWPQRAAHRWPATRACTCWRSRGSAPGSTRAWRRTPSRCCC